jgi:hypothetical protein
MRGDISGVPGTQVRHHLTQARLTEHGRAPAAASPKCAPGVSYVLHWLPIGDREYAASHVLACA